MDHKPPEIAGQAAREPIAAVSEDVDAPKAKQALPMSKAFAMNNVCRINMANHSTIKSKH